MFTNVKKIKYLRAGLWKHGWMEGSIRDNEMDYRGWLREREWHLVSFITIHMYLDGAHDKFIEIMIYAFVSQNGPLFTW